MTRMPPERRERMEWRLQAAYRRFVGPAPLRPYQRPPGLSQLPPPTKRNAIVAQSPIPHYVESLGSVPRKLLPLYESAGDGFALNAAGKALANYRTALAKDPTKEPISYKEPLTRPQWQMLVSIAQPGPERAHFLKCAATKRIKVEG